jgi:glycosyltransferase involved in cell wall biosynthesis
MTPLPSPRIGYVLKRFPRLSETFILNEVMELHREGTPVQIYSLTDPFVVEPAATRHGLLRDLEIPVIYLPRRPALKKGWRIKQGRYGGLGVAEVAWKELCDGDVPEKSIHILQGALVAALAEAQAIGHLHAHFATEAATVALLAHRLTGVPFSFTAHAKDIHHQSVDRSLLQQKIREARFVVTVSEANRQHLVELAGNEFANNIVCLYNGVDLNRFQADPAVGRDPNLIVAVGRLEEKKGFQHLIEACRILRDERQPFRCSIVGEGPERAALVKQIETLGLEENVTLDGACPQELLLDTLQRATVFVLPCVIAATGDRDGLPTVLLEALAVGLPAVSTELVGITEIIEHRKTGLLAPPADPRGLARCIAEVLMNRELQQQLSRNGRIKAEAVFDIRKNIPILRNLFSSSVALKMAGHLDSCGLAHVRARSR